MELNFSGLISSEPPAGDQPVKVLILGSGPAGLAGGRLRA